jgi:hypothetical protein
VVEPAVNDAGEGPQQRRTLSRLTKEDHGRSSRSRPDPTRCPRDAIGDVRDCARGGSSVETADRLERPVP